VAGELLGVAFWGFGGAFGLGDVEEERGEGLFLLYFFGKVLLLVGAVVGGGDELGE
jgi:hypothetical protein